MPSRLAGPSGDLVLSFFRGGWPRPEDSAEPVRRPPSPQATFWSWVAVAMLIAALILPFSLAALVDMVRYLSR
ncbi:hypothetical protein [uncultured Sphingomonas sp.]|uniref:hypothetical protein n=1 Tax=uncultured Sphingomonas sp. TaxID=158754 RepID=UPI0035CC9EC7